MGKKINWAERWHYSMRFMNKEERADLFVNAAMNFDNPVFAEGKLDFMYLLQEHKDFQGYVPTLLEDVAIDHGARQFSNATNYSLAAIYFKYLESGKTGIEERQARTMATYLSGISYSDELYENARTQSRTIDTLSYLLARDLDWDKMPPEERAEFLTTLSNATDYAMEKEGQYEDINMPESKPVRVAPEILEHGMACDGLHTPATDIIAIRQDLGFERTIEILKHEKAHQLSYRKSRYKKDPDQDCDINIKLLGIKIHQFFLENAADQQTEGIYMCKQEEVFAREAEKIQPGAYNLGKLSRIFADAPDEFSKVKNVFAILSQPVMSQTKADTPTSAVSQFSKKPGM